MEIVPHRRESTGAKFTSRAGLTAFAHFMSRLGLSERCEPLFPAVGSSRGCRASEYLHVLVLLLMEAVRHLHAERGWMPMVGRIAATGPVAASDFRCGSRPPN